MEQKNSFQEEIDNKYLLEQTAYHAGCILNNMESKTKNAPIGKLFQNISYRILKLTFKFIN